MRHGMRFGRHGMGGFRGMGFGGRHGLDLDEKLAEALGISVEALQAARETAFANAIQAEVDAGELAPRQAQRILGWQKLRDYIDREALMAQVLEMTPEDLAQALAEGQSPWDLAAERDIDFGTARKRLLEAGKARLQEAVTDGAITQEQADELLNMAGRGPFGRRGVGPWAFMGRRKFGRWGRWGGCAGREDMMA